MRNLYWQLALFLLLTPCVLAAQPRVYTLDGVARIKDGDLCRYVITFSIAGDAISGTSCTTDASGQKLTATISGTINKRKHTLSFAESNMTLSAPGEVACLFDVRLEYAFRDGRHILEGDFTGRNPDHNICGEGSIEFGLHCKPGYLFEKEKPKALPVKADTAQVMPAAGEFKKLTAGSVEEITWLTDSCVLEIWDGEIPDGDIVTISLDNKDVLENYTLVSQRKRVVMPVAAGANDITLEAMNEGKAPPNTSQVIVYDGTRHYSFLVCLQTSKIADIVLKKK